jgi:hemolysin type calcium-binding protein
VGGEGDDEFVVTFGGGSASGGIGADTIVVDTFRTWAIEGGAGPDTIRAGTGQDGVAGGDGNDTIDVSGDPGSADSVSCGHGRADAVYADDDDLIAADCEAVSLSTPVLAAADTARADAAAFVAAMPAIPAF